MTLNTLYWSYVVADSWFSIYFSLKRKLHNKSLHTLLNVISTLMACLMIKRHMHTSRYINTRTILISKKIIVILVPTILVPVIQKSISTPSKLNLWYTLYDASLVLVYSRHWNFKPAEHHSTLSSTCFHFMRVLNGCEYLNICEEMTSY